MLKPVNRLGLSECHFEFAESGIVVVHDSLNAAFVTATIAVLVAKPDRKLASCIRQDQTGIPPAQAKDNLTGSTVLEDDSESERRVRHN